MRWRKWSCTISRAERSRCSSHGSRDLSADRWFPRQSPPQDIEYQGEPSARHLVFVDMDEQDQKDRPAHPSAAVSCQSLSPLPMIWPPRIRGLVPCRKTILFILFIHVNKTCGFYAGSSVVNHFQTTAAITAPTIGPIQYTAWLSRVPDATAGPKARAGFIAAPVRFLHQDVEYQREPDDSFLHY